MFILIDDLGYADLSSYGGDVQSPNIDALANQGMRFTQFYSAAPLCTPTRASLMTGQHPRTNNFSRAINPQSQAGIPSSTKTLPELLRNAGYDTIQIGKWHLGNVMPHFLPVGMGFNNSFRLASENSANFGFSVSTNDGPAVQHSQSEYTTTYITDRAVEYVAQKQGSAQPFFLYLPYLAAHAPWVFPPGFPGDEYDRTTARGRYQAMISDLDAQIKRILDELTARNMLQNTFIFVMSDNGGPDPVHVTNGPLRGFKAQLFDGGIRVPFIAYAPGRIPSGTINNSVGVSYDLFNTIMQLAGVKTSKLNLPGQTLLDVLSDNSTKMRSKPLVWELKNSVTIQDAVGDWNNRAVLDGDFKYVHEQNQDYLFNLANDIGETTDIKAQNPKKFKQLVKYYREWRRSVAKVSYKHKKKKAKKGSDGMYSFKGNGRLNVSDPDVSHVGEDISFLTRIVPGKTKSSKVQHIAESPGFTITLDKKQLLFTVFPTSGSPVIVQGPKLKTGKKHKIAATIYGWTAGGFTARLYVNGKLKAEQTVPDVEVANSNQGLVIGEDFVGKLAKPEIHRLAFTPEEMGKIH